MGIPLGEEWNLWRNTATVASPTWSKVKCVDGLSIATSRDLVELPCRGDVRIGSKPSKLKMPLTGEIYFDLDDTNASAIHSAAMAGTKLHMRLTLEDSTESPATSAGLGYFEDEFYVADFPTDMAIGSGTKFSATFTPAVDVDAAITTVGTFTEV